METWTSDDFANMRKKFSDFWGDVYEGIENATLDLAIRNCYDIFVKLADNRCLDHDLTDYQKDKLSQYFMYAVAFQIKIRYKSTDGSITLQPQMTDVSLGDLTLKQRNIDPDYADLQKDFPISQIGSFAYELLLETALLCRRI